MVTLRLTHQGKPAFSAAATGARKTPAAMPKAARPRVLIGGLGFGYVGVFVAQAVSPVIPAVIGAFYVRHWSRSRGVRVAGGSDEQAAQTRV